jgi:hypothetical protein
MEGGKIINKKSLKEFRKKLRSNLSSVEAIMWTALQKKQLKTGNSVGSTVLETTLLIFIVPCDKSAFVGPSLSYSLTNNISLMAIGQLFWGNSYTEFGDIGHMFFLDLKWSF